MGQEARVYLGLRKATHGPHLALNLQKSLCPKQCQKVWEFCIFCLLFCCCCLFLINLSTSARACLGNHFLLVDEASLSHFRLTSGLEFKINVVLILRHDASLALSKLALLENTITHPLHKLQIQISHANNTILSSSRCLSNYFHYSVSLTTLELPYCWLL